MFWVLGCGGETPVSASAGEEADDSVAKGNKRTTRGRKDERKQTPEDFSPFFFGCREQRREEDRFHLA